MNILVVNDDGIYAPGIEILANAAAQLGRVWVVAPDQQCSAMSHKVTIGGSLKIEKVEDFPVPVEAAYKVSGSPADCVKVALKYLLKEKPDFVFSGINNGYNVGCEIAYSGTMAAAMEAIMHGISAIAFSSTYNAPMTITENYILDIARDLTEKEHNLTEVWNVNFPSTEKQVPKGILYDRSIAPVRLYDPFYKDTIHKDGSISLEIYGLPITSTETVPTGTDMEAVLNGYISIGKVRCSVL